MSERFYRTAAGPKPDHFAKTSVVARLFATAWLIAIAVTAAGARHEEPMLGLPFWVRYGVYALLTAYVSMCMWTRR